MSIFNVMHEIEEASINGDPLKLCGDSRIDLSGLTILAANADGGAFKAGTETAPVVEDTAGMKFMSFFWDCGALAGDARGIYNRLFITGAGGGGESLRSFTTVLDVVGVTAHGAHLSLSFGDTGKISGLGVAARCTLHIANQATQGGTMAAVQAEIYSDGATSDPAGSLVSCIRVVNDGNGTGKADVDDDVYLFDFAGWTAEDGHMISALGNEPVWATGKTFLVKCRLPDGVPGFLVGIVV